MQSVVVMSLATWELRVAVSTPHSTILISVQVVELKSVTTASDIWSVGCLAIELLTGRIR